MNHPSYSSGSPAAARGGPGDRAVHVAPVAFDVTLSSGRLRAHRWGAPGHPLVLCIHGLSANARSFDALAAPLSRLGRQVVAVDLRGRGQSAITGPGSYGWVNHARDVLELGAALGQGPFDVVGHSMGAFVSMQAKALAPERLRSMVLIDAAGSPEPAAIPPILAAVERLGVTYASVEAYLQLVRSSGTVAPWHDVWDTHYRYELEETPEGVRPRTHREAVLEDLAWAGKNPPASLWPKLSGPALLVRSAVPLLPTGGFVLTAADCEAFQRTVPGTQRVDVEANHYGVMTHPATLDATASFLTGV